MGKTHRCVERAMARVIQTRRAAAASAAANEMSPKKKLLLKALAILLGVLLIVSGCGLLVLMDVEKKNALTTSAFGTAWLAVNKGNPILQPMVFNFSFLGLFMIYQQFHPRGVGSRPTATSAGKKKK